MKLEEILQHELRGSYEYFRDFTNLEPDSPGFGLTADSNKKTGIASIAAVGFALSAWVIAHARGYLSYPEALEITKKTLYTLRDRVSHYRGFFAHFLDINNGNRHRKCEYSTIDTALCLNGVITAAAYFQDDELKEVAQEVLERVDWKFLVFEKGGKTYFHMAYNPDEGGDYVTGEPGFIYQWDMAAEQRMMYLQAASQLDPSVAVKVYEGFTRDLGEYDGQKIIITPGGTLFVYLFTEAWFDTGRYLDRDGVDWFMNTRLAALANRSFCMEQAKRYKTYHANSWGISAGDSPWGYAVSGSRPCLGEPRHNGTVSIYSALACLPFTPQETIGMIEYLFEHQPRTWGKYGFYDAYNLEVSPAWYSSRIYGIDKGCSMLLIENYLSGLIWETYTNSATIQNSLPILGFTEREGKQHG